MTLQQLQDGTVNLWDSEVQKSLPSALNPLIRTYFNDSSAKRVNTNAKLDSLAPYNHNDRQVDHFLEIQHVIRLLLSHSDAAAICNAPVGDYLRLSRFLNHEYNLYSIPAAENNYKSRIGIELYVAKSSTFSEDESTKEKRSFIQSYLEANPEGNDQITSVENRILQLLTAMRDATGNYAGLCNLAGARLLDFLKNAHPASKDILDAGGFHKK